MKLYGNLNNRLDENKNYTQRDLQVGDDITMYYWSDRTCYFITKVVNQKHIFVHKYYVCADHSKEGGIGHQNWLYFKTKKEEETYLNECIDKGLINCEKRDLDTIIEDKDEEWVFRHNKWRQVIRYTIERWKECLKQAKKECRFPNDEERVRLIAQWIIGLNNEELEIVISGKELVKYYRINQGISFGVKDYYYDWEF